MVYKQEPNISGMCAVDMVPALAVDVYGVHGIIIQVQKCTPSYQLGTAAHCQVKPQWALS
jgi:hypothetical protein